MGHRRAGPPQTWLPPRLEGCSRPGKAPDPCETHPAVLPAAPGRPPQRSPHKPTSRASAACAAQTAGGVRLFWSWRQQPTEKVLPTPQKNSEKLPEPPASTGQPVPGTTQAVAVGPAPAAPGKVITEWFGLEGAQDWGAAPQPCHRSCPSCARARARR